MKKYAICRHGNRITVKLAGRNQDFGEIINECDTLPEAQLCARVERMQLRRECSKHCHECGRLVTRDRWRYVPGERPLCPEHEGES